MFIEKVTAFITRPSVDGPDLLLFRHPFAGIQIPAGTVRAREKPEVAVLRETAEETGLTHVVVREYLGSVDEELPQGQTIITRSTEVFSRPSIGSSNWAYLRRGLSVRLQRIEHEFAQVCYVEYDQVPDPQYVTLSIIGWVPENALADQLRRHFYHMELIESTEESWTVQTDNHEFQLFWASLSALPEIIFPQDKWLSMLPAHLASGLHRF